MISRERLYNWANGGHRWTARSRHQVQSASTALVSGIYDRGRLIAGAPVLGTEIETLESGFSDISRNPSFVISSLLFYFACNTEGGAGQRL